jgi:hypothetical protein
MEPKVILSLFDHTGNWARPFAEAGHEVIALDIKNEGELGDVNRFSVQYLVEELGIEWVDAIIAAPPCTDFTNSGAWKWKEKDADGRTAASTELVYQTLRTVEFFKPDWWVLENPVGRIHKLVPTLGKPFAFDPADYAGHMATPEDEETIARLRAMTIEEMTQQDIEDIKRLNLYTKKTWLFGDFNRDGLAAAKRRIEPIRATKQGSWTQRLGGKSEKTKAARSATPDGFALAFFQAHDWFVSEERLIEAEDAMEEAA